MDNNVANQQMRKCTNPACGTLLDNLANFCPECGAPAPAVYGGPSLGAPSPALAPVTVGAQSAVVVGTVVADPSSSADGNAMVASDVSQILEPPAGRPALARIHSSIRYQLFMLLVSLVNAATVLADLILEHTHSTVIEDEGEMMQHLRSFFTLLFVMDVAIGLLAWRMRYLRRNGTLHIMVAIVAVLSNGLMEPIGMEQEHFNLWGLTAVKLAGYIRIIRLLLRGFQPQRPRADLETREAPV